MPINKFITNLDLARQAEIYSGETAVFQGGITMGLPFSGFPSGPDESTAVSLGFTTTERATFSGSSTTTFFDVTNLSSPNYNPVHTTLRDEPYTQLDPTTEVETVGATIYPILLSYTASTSNPFNPTNLIWGSSIMSKLYDVSSSGTTYPQNYFSDYFDGIGAAGTGSTIENSEAEFYQSELSNSIYSGALFTMEIFEEGVHGSFPTLVTGTTSGTVTEYSATTFIWTNSNYNTETSGLTLPITTFSSATQTTNPVWTLTQSTIVDENVVGLQYTGYNVTYSFSDIVDVSTGTTPEYHGIVFATRENFSAGTLDYKGSTKWLNIKGSAQVDERLTVDRLTINTLGTGSSVTTLGVDVDGNVVVGLSGATSGLTSYWDEDGTGNTALKDDKGSHTINGVSNNSIAAGGSNNSIDTSTGSTINGGQSNNIDFGRFSFIGGASSSFIENGNTSIILGGNSHNIQSLGGSNKIDGAGIIGGATNDIIDNHNDSDRSFIVGGVNNNINDSKDSFILGSSLSNITNSTSGSNDTIAFIFGGSSHLADSAQYSGILGGNNSTIDDVNNSVIVAGNNNLITSSANNSVILGGENVTADTANAAYFVNGVSDIITGYTFNGNTINMNDGANSPITISHDDQFGGTEFLKLDTTIRLERNTSNYHEISNGVNRNYASSQVILQQTSSTNKVEVNSSGVYVFAQDDYILLSTANFTGSLSSGLQNGAMQAEFVTGMENTVAFPTGEFGTGEGNQMTGASADEYYTVFLSTPRSRTFDNSLYSSIRNNVIAAGSDHSIYTGVTNSAIMGGTGNTITNGTIRSVVLGGQNITGDTDDTVYVPNFNIGNLGTGTSVSNLGIDSNGNVVSGVDTNDLQTVDPYFDGGSLTAITWDVSGNSTNYEITITANTTLNLTNVRDGEYGTIWVEQGNNSGNTITFGTINGAGGTHIVANGGGGSPSLTVGTGNIDILTFTYNGNSNKMGWAVGNDYT